MGWKFWEEIKKDREIIKGVYKIDVLEVKRNTSGYMVREKVN